MKIKELRLRNFRNFKEKDFFFEDVNIIYGKNAQGKTNILEAIYYLCNFKPIKTSKEVDLINFDSDYAYIKGIFEDEGDLIDREVYISKDGTKKLKEMGHDVKKIKDLSGKYGTIFFSPDNLSLIKGSPSVRRRFFDGIISDIKPIYYNYLKDYYKFLMQKNKLLKNYDKKFYNRELLEVFNEEIINLSAIIIKLRIAFIKKFKPLINDLYKDFSGDNSQIDLYYNSPIAEIGEFSIDEIKTRLREEIDRNYQGPHTDDYVFLCGGRDIKRYGSQGEIRTLVLSLIFGKGKIAFESAVKTPIILLDDVLYELDFGRREKLLKYNFGQIFITTTDLKSLPEEILKKALLISLPKEG
ncbi:MAG: DNA replication/repair protein RecF [Thermovenabulum sp.]|uniref:DNA replication/repair protein RecF n=1 Tax=Thermovenabulum sp. TaxID=3100335 RepID=UPI003C7EBA52